MLADDDEGFREYVADALRTHGHDVVSAADGEEAWTLFRTESFDSVITDFRMPRLDGVTLAQRIREHSSVPILIDTSDTAGARAAGAASISFTTVLSPDDLLKVLFSLLVTPSA